MSKFIEVTENEKKVYVNVNWILSVESYDNGSLLKVGANGHRDNPHLYYYVAESYEVVKALLNI